MIAVHKLVSASTKMYCIYSAEKEDEKKKTQQENIEKLLIISGRNYPCAMTKPLYRKVSVQ